MEKGTMELIASVQTITEVKKKIQRGILQRDAIWPLIFVVAVIQLNHVPKKRTQEKINCIMYMDDINLFAKKKKKRTSTWDSDTNNKNIQPGYNNGIWHWKMWHAPNKKWGRRNHERIIRI